MPELLLKHFLHNTNSVKFIEDKEYLNKYREDLKTHFQRLFNKTFDEAIAEMEGKTTHNIRFIFKYLYSDHFLFELHQTFDTFEGIMGEIFGNPKTFIGLIRLIAGFSQDSSLLTHQQLLDYATIDGLVFYKKLIKREINENITLSILKHAGQDEIRGYKKRFNNSEFTIFEKGNDVYLVFKQSNLKDYNDLVRNFLAYNGKEQLFKDPKYNKSLRVAEQVIDRYQDTKNIKIAGFSLGGIMSLYLGLKTGLKTEVYSPVLPDNELWNSLLDLEQDYSNIRIHTVKNDAISRNVQKFKSKFDKTKIRHLEYKKRDLLSHHDLNNF